MVRPPHRWGVWLSGLAAAPAAWGLLLLAGAILERQAVVPIGADAVAGPVLQAGSGLVPGLVIGASGALLLFALVGNMLLAFGTGRRSFLWYAGWAALVPVWAIFELQLSLIVFPGLSPMQSLDIGGFAAILAVVAAGIGLTEALRHDVPQRLARWLRIAAAAVLVAGIAHAFDTGPYVALVASFREFAVVTAATLAGAACRLAWHRNQEAHDFAISFSLPTLAMIGTLQMPFLPKLPAASGNYVVLIACAVQTFGLMLIAARRLFVIQRERDAALYQQHALTELAERDPLTGLYNRRGFVRRADALLARTAGAAMVLIDLDRFKQVNDSHGHDVGDRLLRATADALREAGGGALLGRLGGEEFAAVIADCSDAPGLAERLRLAVGAVALPDVAPAVAITASAGVSAGHGPRAFLTAYRAADRALFAAKRAGRDCSRDDHEQPVVVAGALA